MKAASGQLDSIIFLHKVCMGSDFDGRNGKTVTQNTAAVRVTSTVGRRPSFPPTASVNSRWQNRYRRSADCRFQGAEVTHDP